MPSQRISADTLTNLPVPEFGEPSNDPAADRLRAALERYGADLPMVAAELGITVREVYQQARKFGIQLAHYR